MDEPEEAPGSAHGPVPRPDPIPAASPSRRRPLRRRGVALLAASVLVGVPVILTRDESVTAAEQLAAIRTFLTEARTAHFDATIAGGR